MTTIAQQVILAIIQNNLISAKCECGKGCGCIIIWSSCAEEQIDAIIQGMMKRK